MLTTTENPILDRLGTRLNSELIQWAQSLEKQGLNMNLSGRAHTITENGTFRLDKQGEFPAHGIQWYNLQVQHRDVTLFTVYVQANGWENGIVREHSVLYRVKQGAHRGYVEQTVYVAQQNKAVASERERPQGVDAASILLNP